IAGDADAGVLHRRVVALSVRLWESGEIVFPAIADPPGFTTKLLILRLADQDEPFAFDDQVLCRCAHDSILVEAVPVSDPFDDDHVVLNSKLHSIVTG